MSSARHAPIHARARNVRHALVLATAATLMTTTAASAERLSQPPAPTTVAPASTCPSGAPIRRVALTDGSRKIALTFDDGPWPGDTVAVMDLLAEFGVEGKATFFQVGRNAEEHPALTRAVARRGYGVGVHTMTHKYQPATIAAEIEPTRDLLEGLTGSRPIYFRAPGLTRGAAIDDEVRRTGMCNVSTAFDLRDTLAPRPTAAQLVTRFQASVHPGDIVLLHVEGGRGRAASREALRQMLAWALDQGEAGGRFEIVGLDELMASGTPLTTMPSTAPRARRARAHRR